MVGGWLIEKGSSSGANPKSLRVHRTRYTACTQHKKLQLSTNPACWLTWDVGAPGPVNLLRHTVTGWWQ